MAMVPMIAVMINVSVIMEVLHRQLVVVLRMEQTRMILTL